jgi:Leucine-rich repeat (LRR) protein
VIPSEIFLFEQLVVLKLRNNPIREIPSDIAQLRNLQVLIIPFCLLTHLPLRCLLQFDCAFCCRIAVK